MFCAKRMQIKIVFDPFFYQKLNIIHVNEQHSELSQHLQTVEEVCTKESEVSQVKLQ